MASKETNHYSLKTLSAYLENNSSAKTKRDIGRHLLHCTHCQESLEKLQEVDRKWQALRLQAPQPQLPRDFLSKLFKKLKIDG